MPIPTGPFDQTPSFFPTPPNPTISSDFFPNDLKTGERNFYTSIQIAKYSAEAFGFGVTSGNIFGNFRSVGGINLPIPKKLNDITTVTWEAQSDVTMAGQIGSSVLNNLPFGAGSAIQSVINAGAAGAAIAGARAGVSLNPALWMTFKHPNFKVHSMSWTLAPNNEQESNTLARIINNLKFHMLPEPILGGFVYGYPSIALIKLYPDDAFTFRLLPCAIESVSVDWTGGGQPSFFRTNGAPTIVNLTVQFKEIDLWTKGNYGGANIL